jgi:arsenite oxidase small subunit
MGRKLNTVSKSRRSFLRGCAASAGAAAVLGAQSARANCEPPSDDGVQRLGELLLAGVDDLAVDGSLTFEYPAGHPCILVRLREPAAGGVGPGNALVAFSAICPHRGWRLDSGFRPEHGALGPCPGHNSTFDLCKGGAQVVGQANRDLPRVLLEQRGAEIYAVGLAGAPFRFDGSGGDT